MQVTGRFGRPAINSSVVRNFSEGFKIWIDLDDNGSFEDAGELVFSPSATSPGGNSINNSISGTINLPGSSPFGTHRLRARSVFATTSFTSTSSHSFGETEDYTYITIGPSQCNPSDISADVMVIAGPAATCGSVVNTYSVSGNSSSNVSWYMSTVSASGPFTFVSSGTSASIPFFGSGTFYLQATEECCGATNSSNVLTITNVMSYDDPCNSASTLCGTSNVISCGANGPYSNAGLGVDAGEPAPPGKGCNVQNGWCNNGLEHTAWFAFTVPANSDGSAEILVDGFDTQAALWDPSAFGSCSSYAGWALVGANDDGGTAHGGTASFSSWIGIPACTLIPGRTYYLQVDRYVGATGDFTVNVTCTNAAPPVFSGVGPNQTINCPDTPVFSNPTAVGQCCAAIVDFIDDNTFIGPCSYNYSVTRTWTATDCYGNTSTASQTITVHDATASVITTQASDMTVECEGEGNMEWNGLHTSSLSTAEQLQQMNVTT